MMLQILRLWQLIWLVRTAFPRSHTKWSPHSWVSSTLGTAEAVHGKLRLRPWNLSASVVLREKLTDGQTRHTLFQAPRVSTFGFPKRLKKVTQQSKAAPILSAAPPSPLHLSLKTSGHGHHKLRPRNQRRKDGRSPHNWKRPTWPMAVPATANGLPEFPLTLILRLHYHIEKQPTHPSADWTHPAKNQRTA